MSREQGGPRRGRDTGEQPAGVAVRKYITFIKFVVLYGHRLWYPKTIYRDH